MIRKAALIITLCAISALGLSAQPETTGSSSKNRVERVRPVLSKDQFLNKTLIYVSENCNLVIPAGRNIDEIEGKVYCSFTVDTMGNISSVWVTRGVAHWIDRAVSQAIMDIPAWNGYFRDDDAKKTVRHEVIFTFNSRRGLGYSDLNSVMGKQYATMNKQIESDRQKNIKEKKFRLGQWNDFRDENILETINAENKTALRGIAPDNMILKNPAGQDILRPKTGVTISVEVD